MILPLERTLADPARARHFTLETLSRAGGVAESVCDDAVLLVSELVTNVVRHGALPAQLEVQVDAAGIRIAVRDSGGHFTVPAAGLPRPDQGGGRGLFLVATIARTWGMDLLSPGKSVWFELGEVV